MCPYLQEDDLFYIYRILNKLYLFDKNINNYDIYKNILILSYIILYYIVLYYFNIDIIN